MYRIKLDVQSESDCKERIQNATDGAGLSGNVMHFEGRSLNTRKIFIKIF